MLKKFIFIEKTSKYISISSYWVGRINLLNTQQTLIYLNPNVMSSDFGKAIKEKLNESDLISEDLFMFHFNDNEGLSLFNKNEEKKVMSVYGYKSAKAICKDA
ncbi:TPA: CdiI family contact-dependent growth inhibition immunity protein, partial [Pasteurella multocida]|nr:CdiI family contact-dependent growth inhibition immunity protein [Pasteurella multocida]